MNTDRHGDYKAMNVFLPVADGDDALLIDFASTGVGHVLNSNFVNPPLVLVHVNRCTN
jgi:hypothetical protein